MTPTAFIAFSFTTVSSWTKKIQREIFSLAYVILMNTTSQMCAESGFLDFKSVPDSEILTPAPVCLLN